MSFCTGEGVATHRIVSSLKGLAEQALHDDVPLHAGVVGDQPGGADQGLAHDLGAQLFLGVCQGLDELGDKLCEVQQRSAAACAPKAVVMHRCLYRLLFERTRLLLLELLSHISPHSLLNSCPAAMVKLEDSNDVCMPVTESSLYQRLYSPGFRPRPADCIAAARGPSLYTAEDNQVCVIPPDASATNLYKVKWMSSKVSTWNNALLHCCKGGVLGVLYPQFPVFQFCFRGCSNLIDEECGASAATDHGQPKQQQGIRQLPSIALHDL